MCCALVRWLLLGDAAPGGEAWFFKGGWFDLTHLLAHTREVDYMKYKCDGDTTRVIAEVKETVERSVGQRETDKRFKLEELGDGRVLVKANYHHSFDVDDPALPCPPQSVFHGEAVQVPSLKSLCVRHITENIDMYEGIGECEHDCVVGRVASAWETCARSWGGAHQRLWLMHACSPHTHP